jgi:hypothetical protein
MVLTWLSVCYLLYKAALWWDIQRKPVPTQIPEAGVTAPRLGSSPSAQAAMPPKTSSRQQPFPVESETPATDARTVRRCIVDGNITFTDRTCPNGSKTSSVTVNTANVGTVAPKAPQAPPVQITPQIATSQAPTTQVIGMAKTNQLDCASLELEIKRIDAMARQPLSGQAQDVLAEERKKIRSRQFTLHC